MNRLISSKLGKVEVRVLLFCFISFLVVTLGLNLVNRNLIEHTARAQPGDAYVETDQADYSAGDMAEIFGSGWQPGESVMLEILSDPPTDPEAPPDTLNVVADSEGNISNQYMIPGHGYDQTFSLTATGLDSGFSAQTTFTNNINSASPPMPEIEDSVLATVMTDKDDYFPGEVVQITGSGWEPGETVELYLVGEPLTHDPETLYAVADESGHIFAQYVVQEYDLGRAFTLTATGMTSGLIAQTTFTDANSTINAFSFTGIPDGSTVVAGSALPWTASAICTGNNAQCLGDGGTTNGAAVPNGYIINIGRRGTSGVNCTGASTQQDTATTSSGSASGSFNAPNTAGVFCFTALHPNQNQFPSQGQGWNPASSGDIKLTVTLCGNGTVNSGEQCDDGNRVSGDCCSSTCQFESAGSMCGDQSDTVCDNPDTCNATGTCQDNFEPTSTSCRADTGECDVEEFCDGAGACPDDGFEPEGTMCGDRSDTVCDNPDTCNATGTCQDNFEPPTTTCGDPSDTQCTDPDTCDGAGSCDPHNAANNTPCSDDPNACTINDFCTDGVCGGGAYDFDGYRPPVENPPMVNTVKAGSGVPVKFSLKCDAGLDIFGVDPWSGMVTCDTTYPVSDVEETVTAGKSELHYDAAADQYVYVWKTQKGWANTCRKLKLTLDDGTTHVALFKFAK